MSLTTKLHGSRICRKFFGVSENEVQILTRQLIISATLGKFLNCLNFHFLVSLQFSFGNRNKMDFII